MSPSNSAEYQRAYRARKKTATRVDPFPVGTVLPDVHAACDQKIANLTAELKGAWNALRQMSERAPASGAALLPDVPRSGDSTVADSTSLDRGAANQGPSTFAGRGVPASGANPATTMQGVWIEQGSDASSLVLPTASGGMAMSSLSSSTPRRIKPSFLAAPDEDCVCGHDRHAYHAGWKCGAWVNRKPCPCEGFMADLHFE